MSGTRGGMEAEFREAPAVVQRQAPALLVAQHDKGKHQRVLQPVKKHPKIRGVRAAELQE